jgi:phosphate transport system permease protein
VLPFRYRQILKPVIEILAAIPSVAYGFFALVIFAPLLQEHGGTLLSAAVWIIGTPVALLLTAILSDLAVDRMPVRSRKSAQVVAFALITGVMATLLYMLAHHLNGLEIQSGRNALNVAVGWALWRCPRWCRCRKTPAGRWPRAARRQLRPWRHAGRDHREVVIPPPPRHHRRHILGTMRALGETMVGGWRRATPRISRSRGTTCWSPCAPSRPPSPRYG